MQFPLKWIRSLTRVGRAHSAAAKQICYRQRKRVGRPVARSRLILAYSSRCEFLADEGFHSSVANYHMTKRFAGQYLSAARRDLSVNIELKQKERDV
jgi:hypothetical protein